ncbi:GNAT family N-acetyltransferase [Sulfurimonas sp. SAG-AH-194-C21]|nr:GNAT family N-acetyltransferase [Sulfurimonas sp. SAG-AH-194-C21]MDF1883040.1 GNAT family N-acetyltransferase [Sulfurimonas sp. SAG-AH-194-C21]
MRKELAMIREAKYEELEAISILMHEVFESKMRKLYTPEAQNSFLNQITLESLQESYNAKNIFYVNEEITAVLEFETYSHIAFLFSKDENRGNARALCEYAFKHKKSDALTVGAFKNAIAYYEKIGFTQVSEEIILEGINFTIMERKI